MYNLAFSALKLGSSTSIARNSQLLSQMQAKQEFRRNAPGRSGKGRGDADRTLPSAQPERSRRRGRSGERMRIYSQAVPEMHPQQSRYNKCSSAPWAAVKNEIRRRSRDSGAILRRTLSRGRQHDASPDETRNVEHCRMSWTTSKTDLDENGDSERSNRSGLVGKFVEEDELQIGNHSHHSHDLQRINPSRPQRRGSNNEAEPSQQRRTTIENFINNLSDRSDKRNPNELQLSEKSLENHTCSRLKNVYDRDEKKPYTRPSRSIERKCDAIRSVRSSSLDSALSRYIQSQIGDESTATPIHRNTMRPMRRKSDQCLTSCWEGNAAQIEKAMSRAMRRSSNSMLEYVDELNLKYEQDRSSRSGKSKESKESSRMSNSVRDRETPDSSDLERSRKSCDTTELLLVMLDMEDVSPHTESALHTDNNSVYAIAPSKSEQSGRKSLNTKNRQMTALTQLDDSSTARSDESKKSDTESADEESESDYEEAKSSTKVFRSPFMICTFYLISLLLAGALGYGINELLKEDLNGCNGINELLSKEGLNGCNDTSSSPSYSSGLVSGANPDTSPMSMPSQEPSNVASLPHTTQDQLNLQSLVPTSTGQLATSTPSITQNPSSQPSESIPPSVAGSTMPSYGPTPVPSSLPSSNPSAEPECPDQLLKSVLLDNGLTLKYEVVLYHEMNELGGLLCVKLEYAAGTPGWLGFAISKAKRNPLFERREAVIGIPGVQTSVAMATDNPRLGQQHLPLQKRPDFANPGKYTIPAGGIDKGYFGPSLSLLSGRQTLVDGSISTDEDGSTILSFAKYLREPWEIDVDPYAETLVLFAVGQMNDDKPEWKHTFIKFLEDKAT